MLFDVCKTCISFFLALWLISLSYALQALAELYVINSQYEKALSLYAEVSTLELQYLYVYLKLYFCYQNLFLIKRHLVQLLKPEVFEFIEKYNLHDAICDKVPNGWSLSSNTVTFFRDMNQKNPSISCTEELVAFLYFIQAVNLMILDSKRTVHLLIQHRDIIPPYEVVEQLLHTNKSCDKRYFLHLYLHALFEIDIHAGKDYHDMQVFGYPL